MRGALLAHLNLGLSHKLLEGSESDVVKSLALPDQYDTITKQLRATMGMVLADADALASMKEFVVDSIGGGMPSMLPFFTRVQAAPLKALSGHKCKLLNLLNRFSNILMSEFEPLYIDVAAAVQCVPKEASIRDTTLISQHVLNL